jgi:protein required for attachment to host cells
MSSSVSHNANLLIVIADGAHARFVRPAANGEPHTVSTLDSAMAHKRSSDIGSDHPGAAFHSQSTAHHAYQPRHDLHELAETEFAHFLAGEIDAAFARGEFQQLVLAAPPRTLNAIREKLDAGTARAIIGTLGKELMKTPDHALATHLQQWLEPPTRA